MGEMTIEAELGSGFQHRILVAAGRLANYEHGAKVLFAIALLLALQNAPDGGAIVLQGKGLARGQNVKGKGGLGDVKRDTNATLLTDARLVLEEQAKAFAFMRSTDG